jgi:histidine triad (HIT) family protein
MVRHAPPGYVCPFCRIASGDFGGGGLLSVAEDVIYRTDWVVAFVASHWWWNNPGHVIVIPAAHVENLYELPKELAGEVHEAARRVALAMKAAYGCEGVSTRQHNEPAGGQDVWHYHLHVFPRWAGDDLYLNDRSKRATSPQERLPYARNLQRELRDGPGAEGSGGSSAV